MNASKQLESRVTQRCLTRIATLLAIVISAASCDGDQPQYRQYVIESPDGGDCESLDGSWEPEPVPTCSMRSLTLGPNETLTIRRAAKVVVSSQFVSSGSILIGDASDTAPGFASLVLGDEEVIAGAGVNNGFILIIPRVGIASPGLDNRLQQLVNTGTILNLKAGELGGILNNFGTIFNQGQIINTGFFHNSGPPVQPAIARVISVGEDAYLFNVAGVMENMGVIQGPVIGECPGNCS
jgi:hypothetical protein